MPKLFLSRDHALPPEVIRGRIQIMEEKLRDKYRADTRWEDDGTMRVKGPGVDGTLSLHPGRVEIDLNLGFLLGPMKGKIEEGLGRALDKMVRPESESA